MLAAAVLATVTAFSQTNATIPTIYVQQQQSVASAARTIGVNVISNVDYTYSTDAPWVKLTKGANGVFVTVAENYSIDPRTANVTFSDPVSGLSRVMQIDQEKATISFDGLSDDIIKPSSASANTSQTGYGIEKSYDGDYSTYYHSQYQGTPFYISDIKPAILTYNFKNVDVIDYINYIPRQDNNTNGYFRLFELWVKCEGDADYRLYSNYDWSMGTGARTISFGDEGLKKPVSIQFKVYDAINYNASCAEMEFCKRKPTPGMDLFADDLLTTLKPEVTIEALDTISSPLLRSLIYQILQGEYKTEYRAARYRCYNSPQYYSNLWNAPGKYYDQIAGVTGINLEPGTTQVVYVTGIPDDMTASLRVVAWYEGKDGSNFDGGNPITSEFALHNGWNVVNYTFGYAGLAYVCYYDNQGTSATRPQIGVHFVNGDINGYLSCDKTNEEMNQILQNSKNICMDLFGSKVHSVWTRQGLLNYCKASDGTSLGYRQYINFLDSLVDWEHELLGFKKYNLIPDLRTMAYVNYTYYMFQGGFGVSFHHNTESQVLNCKHMFFNDEDKVWGLSHEWGHQHQMHPYFCWSGMTEVTNNMNSYYNVVKMGYTEDGHSTMPKTGDNSGLDIWNETVAKSQEDQTTYSDGHNARQYAYEHRSEYAWNTKLYELCTAMEDSLYTSTEVNKYRAFAYNNYYCMRPFVALYQYATQTLGLSDFGPDLYEALRQTDREGGSVIEKTGIDKYELIAAAQNSNKNGSREKLSENFPESTWVVNSYIRKNDNYNSNAAPYILNFVRKTSRLTGYNLFPYFEKCGFLRQIAMAVGDYGMKWYLLTPDMYNEFKADMDALVESGELKECSEGMVKAILTQAWPLSKRPNIPN